MTRRSLTIPLPALALVLCLGRSCPTADEGWTPPFDGKTLDGWKVNGGFARYAVEDGTIVGTTVDGSPNTFLCKGDYKDFEVRWRNIRIKELKPGESVPEGR